MSWLTADELEHAVDCCSGNTTVKRAFRGVYPHNKLPTFIRPIAKGLPLTLIVNTDTHNLPGRHWISIYIGPDGQGEIFDSLATAPSAYVARFLSKHCKRWTTNRPLIYQHPFSSYCGVYVLLHVLQRHKYNSLEEFCTSNFTSSVTENERFIRAYYKHNFLPYLRR